MKTRNLVLTIVGLMAAVMVTSCSQAAKKDAKEVNEDVKELNKDLIKGAKDTDNEIKTAVNADWEKFKTASETAIENTENEIKALRVKISKAGKKEQAKLTADLDRLEKKNMELRTKLAQRSQEFKENVIEFNNSAIEKEHEFEREFTHDMNELGASIKDLFKNNVD